MCLRADTLITALVFFVGGASVTQPMIFSRDEDDIM